MSFWRPGRFLAARRLRRWQGAAPTDAPALPSPNLDVLAPEKPDAHARGPQSPGGPAERDTSETRRNAQIDLLAGVGEATDRNLALGKILRDVFALVEKTAALSAKFDATAETTRTRAAEFVARVGDLQGQGSLIEARLRQAHEVVETAHARSQSALASVEELTRAVGEIERVVQMIRSIAEQTNLLALNATIEAARAGPMGAGFGVVAQEVKGLSTQTERATQDVIATVKQIHERARANMSEVVNFEQTISALQDVISAVNASVGAQSNETRAIGAGSEEVAQLALEVRSGAAEVQQIGSSVHSMAGIAETAAESARLSFARLTERAAIVLGHSDDEALRRGARWPVVLAGRLSAQEASLDVRIIELSEETMQIECAGDVLARLSGETAMVEIEGIGRVDLRLLTPTISGFETVVADVAPAVRTRIAEKVSALGQAYQPYIARVQRVASRVIGIIEDEVLAGRLSMETLFDTNYRRDGEADPPQYLNDAVVPLERLTRDLLERELTVAPCPDFCILQDRNGFNPVHNLVYSKPPRADDRVWNLRHSRMRRIFDDKVGMAGSRNLRPFIVQSYARDMGNAIEIRMEFDAPLFIRGRHWGALRMAYQLS